MLDEDRFKCAMLLNNIVSEFDFEIITEVNSSGDTLLNNCFRSEINNLIEKTECSTRCFSFFNLRDRTMAENSWKKTEKDEVSASRMLV